MIEGVHEDLLRTREKSPQTGFVACCGIPRFGHQIEEGWYKHEDGKFVVSSCNVCGQEIVKMLAESHMKTLHNYVGGNFSTDNEMDESSCDVCGQKMIKMEVKCHDITLHKLGLKLAG